MKYFCDCLGQRKQGSPGVVDGFNVDIVIGAIAESSQKKVAVKIDWQGI